MFIYIVLFGITGSRPIPRNEILNDLINVNGIGEITLSNIKSQGLACVDENLEQEKENKTVIRENPEPVINYTPKEIKIQLDEINLNQNPKDIKGKNDTQDLSKKTATYGLVFFCILLGSLFFLKRNRNKNEFE